MHQSLMCMTDLLKATRYITHWTCHKELNLPGRTYTKLMTLFQARITKGNHDSDISKPLNIWICNLKDPLAQLAALPGVFACMPIAVCHPYLKLSCDILEKGCSGGTSRADSWRPGNKESRKPNDQPLSFPSFLQMCTAASSHRSGRRGETEICETADPSYRKKLLPSLV